jgi:hypothetical protein
MILGLAAAATPPPLVVSTAEELQRLFAQPVEAIHVRLEPGEYVLTPSPYTDPLCGNCPDPQQSAQTMVGLHIRGTNVRITGPDDRSAVIRTNAGYGVLIEDCHRIVIENLTITGGKRSSDGNATDAAIVVRNSEAIIRNNTIADNLGDEDVVQRTVSGVMGITGRENSRMTIAGNIIRRSSWDGIALYRDAQAVIENNVIDGVDAATGATLGGGRGVGIGVTWNAKAIIRGNLVRRYWKGIGLFVNADATVEHNIVEEILTWGISLWDAGGPGAEPVGHIRSNAVYRTGACGVAITSRNESEDPGEFVGNVIVRTAQDERYDPPDRYCFQCALALHRVPKRFRVEGNLFFANRRASDDLPDHDLPEAEFRAAVLALCAQLGTRPSLRSSSFLAEFYESNETAAGLRCWN